MYGYIIALVALLQSSYIEQELQRFPPKDYCDRQHQLLSDRISYLDSQHPLFARRWHKNREELNRIRELYHIYDLMMDVRKPFYSLDKKIEILRCLQLRIGDSNYMLGQLPIPGEDY